MAREHEFTEKDKKIIRLRASYICSNPSCRCLTVYPTEEDFKGFPTGKVSHIYPASQNGPRSDSSISPDFIENAQKNGIYLCAVCADKIDKNDGKDYKADKLHNWKKIHEEWIRANLNKSQQSPITVVQAKIRAKGINNVIGAKINKPTIMKPGTTLSAEGYNNVTGLQIGGDKEEDYGN